MLRVVWLATAASGRGTTTTQVARRLLVRVLGCVLMLHGTSAWHPAAASSCEVHGSRALGPQAAAVFADVKGCDRAVTSIA